MRELEVFEEVPRSGQLPQKVSNRLLLASIAGLAERLEGLQRIVLGNGHPEEGLLQRVGALEGDMEERAVCGKESRGGWLKFLYALLGALGTGLGAWVMKGLGGG